METLHQQFEHVKREPSFGMTRSMNITKAPLITFSVGSYQVSTAATIQDLNRIDQTKFVVDADPTNILAQHYSGSQWSFIVAGLSKDQKYHPLCYSYPLPTRDTALFIPLRHYHRHEGYLYPDEKGDYDHEIYVLGLPKDPADAILYQPGQGGLPLPESLYQNSRFNELSGRRITFNVPDEQKINRLFLTIANKLSGFDVNSISFGERGVYQWKIKGDFDNGDAQILPYGDQHISTQLSRNCDACTSILSSSFFRCTSCKDIDVCLNCHDYQKPINSNEHQTHHIMIPVRTWRDYAIFLPQNDIVMLMSGKLKRALTTNVACVNQSHFF